MIPPSGLDIGIFGEREYQVKAGTSLSFTCHVDEGLAVILRYRLEWIHVSLADPMTPVETVLTSQQTLQDTASPDVYAVNVAYDANNLNISLTVKTGENSRVTAWVWMDACAGFLRPLAWTYIYMCA